jgi:uncharacterized protein YlbG (UPF0298 family)
MSKKRKQLKLGKLYFFDRRVKFFYLYKQILSRQHSANHVPDNVWKINIVKAPENNTALVLGLEEFFGKKYCKVFFSNTQKDFMIGYILLNEFEKLIKGKLEWVILRDIFQD